MVMYINRCRIDYKQFWTLITMKVTFEQITVSFFRLILIEFYKLKVKSQLDLHCLVIVINVRIRVVPLE